VGLGLETIEKGAQLAGPGLPYAFDDGELILTGTQQF
jgi:hypothetical protein